MDDIAIAEFVAATAARRAAAGKAPRIEDAAVYRLLDGLLARQEDRHARSA